MMKTHKAYKDGNHSMKTSGLNRPLWVTCAIVSMLVGVRTAPAASAKQSRTTPQNHAGTYTEAGISDPGTANPTAQPSTTATDPSGTTVPLATLLSRVRKQAKTSGTTDEVSRIEAPSRIGGEHSDSLSKDLWSSRVVVPETNEDAETSLALRRLIRQVRSVKFDDGKDKGPTFTAPESKPVARMQQMQPDEAAEALSATPTTDSITAGIATTASSEPSTSLPTKAQKTLQTLQQNPNQARDPLDIAELLFLSGRAAEAAPFYAKALDRMSKVDPSYDADRAWILFQLGNCLRETDISKAQDVYMKLASEYPDSPWTELAKAHGRLLTWYQKSRPGRVAASPQL